MKELIKPLIIILFLIISTKNYASENELRILTWDGYITKNDLKNLDKIFKENNISIKSKIIKPFAEGSDQMFDLIRDRKCDVSFLTLFFIKMKKMKVTKLLEPINTHSKRLTNFKHLLKSTTDLEMGMMNGERLYIPYGGGVYGFYANMDKVKPQDVPRSLNELWLPKWKGKISLNKSQIWYNIGISLMALDMPPFYLTDLLNKGKRKVILELRKKDGIVQKKVDALYKQAGNFWTSGTKFSNDLSIVSSWGPEIKERNEKHGGNWKRINFNEGNVVWLDTINFVKGIKGEKLIAAELMANYFIGKIPQTRIVNELSMISVSKQITNNPLINENPNLFQSERFVPPYSTAADNLMQEISATAMKNRTKK